MTSRVRRGDIYEIATDQGLGYFQVTHRDQTYGYLIRVLQGLHSSRPSATDLVHAPTQFRAFFPVPYALKEGSVSYVARFPLAAEDDSFPVMKVPGLRDQTGRVERWWLYNGVEEWHVGTLTDAQAAFPTAAVINDTLLAERIVSGWNPILDVRSAK